VLCACIAVAARPAAAQADFTAATLVSGNSEIPFESASSPALSQDGRYLAFSGTIAGVEGVYRRDLQTGELQLVAHGDGSAPSISADGRYVAFTATDEPESYLAPGADEGCSQVYVRDMTLEPGKPGAYTLASTLGHGGAGEELFYEINRCSGRYGAVTAPGVALSADGRQVVFTVLCPSNLAPGVTGAEVAVRDLDTQETTLVSEAFGSEGQPLGKAPEGGGAYPSASASISGDGSTVAWQGTDVPQQVPSATDVTTNMATDGGEAKEVEPLWRRIGDGPSAVTKRLLAGAGLNFYFTGSHEESGKPIEGGALYQVTPPAPALSEHGNVAVAISNATTATNEASYGFLLNQPPPPTDAYLVAVNADPDSQPQVTPLTATPNFTAAHAFSGGVTNVAISPDGSRVAFETRRTSFALPAPALISPPAPETPFAYTYDVNLPLDTLQQVTSTFDGSPPNGATGQLSFSGDDLTLAFESSATNLIFGTPTAQVSQIYLTHETSTSTPIAAQSLGSVPATPLPLPSWILSATATAEPNGSVLLDAQAPGGGTLAARAVAQLPQPAKKNPAHRSRKPRGKRVHTAVASKRARKRAGTGLAIATHTIAQADARAEGASELQLSLHVDPAYRAQLLGKLGLYALLELTFTAPGHTPLSEEIPVTFHVQSKARASRKRQAGKTPR
jgi:Tol biopolymer transport system component